MANNEKQKESEYYIDENDNDANEDAESTKFDIESSNESGSDHDENPDAFSSHQWPQSYKYILCSSVSHNSSISVSISHGYFMLFIY